MPICFVLPGFVSSGLAKLSNPIYRVWVNYANLSLGDARYMRLAPNGIDPGPPDGEALFQTGPLADYWDMPVKRLEHDLGPHGYTIAPFGYDWRLSILRGGALLADDIRQRVLPSSPCSIVAHSTGGLLSRVAWASLVASGEQGLVRRIVTIATPHQGCYAPVSTLSRDNYQLDQLSFLNTVVGGSSVLVAPFVPRRILSVPELARITATWPCMYHLFPMLGGTAAAADPLRGALFAPGAWPADRGISAAWLTEARDVIGPFLRDPVSMPPPWVLTTVAGYGVPTADEMLHPTLIGTPQAYGSTDQGDNTVTLISALVPESAQYTLQARHADLPRQAALTGDLAEWVLDVRTPVDPVPPPTTIAGAILPSIGGPPIPEDLGAPGSIAPCLKGKCPC